MPPSARTTALRHSVSVSDNWIRLIPTAPTWKPESTAAEAALAYVSGLFAGPGDSTDEVSAEYHDRVSMIDSGVNTASFTCAACSVVTDVDWVFEVVDERSADPSDLNVVLPCCGAPASLNDLNYDWPMGFARFEICVLNGTRAQCELDESELRQVGELLGHPVRQVLAHY